MRIEKITVTKIGNKRCIFDEDNEPNIIPVNTWTWVRSQQLPVKLKLKPLSSQYGMSIKNIERKGNSTIYRAAFHLYNRKWKINSIIASNKKTTYQAFQKDNIILIETISNGSYKIEGFDYNYNPIDTNKIKEIKRDIEITELKELPFITEFQSL